MEWCSSRAPDSGHTRPGNGERFPPPPEKCRLTKSRIKTLLIDSKGLIHHRFVSAATTVNAESYEGVLKCLLQSKRRVRPRLYQSGQWKLLHDNAHCDPREALPTFTQGDSS
ncbi:hypothetical protein AVEN_230569-1 [Araneus ventricosus]|uniref:Uncharacterized protein n=1 Tax=Araneus ventricosus TaxID=182803 RepID=A0A4Y2GIJ8_ARAVE|nr:hypothetical protein AVEN_230569-1 [Araneus ventricosus]